MKNINIHNNFTFKVCTLIPEININREFIIYKHLLKHQLYKYLSTAISIF